MQVKDFAAIVRRELADTNQSAHGAAKSHDLPEDAIRSVLDGHAPRLDRLIEICNALGLELYIGKPRPQPRGLDPNELLDILKKRDEALLAAIRAILGRGA